MLNDERDALRRKMRVLRDSISPDERAAAACAVESILFASDMWRKAQSVFVYCAIGSELSTRGVILAALAQGKEVFLPKCGARGAMRALRIFSVDELKSGRFGIPEPTGDMELNGTPDLCIVPGLAFDAHGGRLGYGGGYYDRFLSRADTTAVALAYAAQVVGHVPVCAHDVPVDYIITPAGLIACDERA